MESSSHVFYCKLGRASVTSSSAQTSTGFKGEEGHLSAGRGRVIAWTPVAPVSSRISCRFYCISQWQIQATIMRFTLFPQSPTPIFNLVSHEHEACIYVSLLQRQENWVYLKEEGLWFNSCTTWPLVFILYYPQNLCTLNYKLANFNIF